MSEWISVEDELPKNDDPVLIYPGVELSDWHCVGNYDPWREHCFIVSESHSYGTEEYKHMHVTHWMPLPRPPGDTNEQ